jgi:hypothetical protein
MSPSGPRTCCPSGLSHDLTAPTYRAGKAALWYCKGCFKGWRQGRLACSKCCGYAAKSAEHVTAVVTAYGKPNPQGAPTCTIFHPPPTWFSWALATTR